MQIIVYVSIQFHYILYCGLRKSDGWMDVYNEWAYALQLLSKSNVNEVL